MVEDEVLTLDVELGVVIIFIFVSDPEIFHELCVRKITANIRGRERERESTYFLI